MDNKKIVSVAVLAVLVLAFAGYGYADYTASTYNEGNNVEVNYITVTPGQWSAIVEAKEINLDTYTYNDDYDVLYVLPDGMTLDNNGYVQLGEDYVLTITDGTTDDFSKYTVDVTIQGEIASATNFKLYLDCNGTTKALASGMSFNVEDETVTLKLLMEVTGYDTEINFPTADGWEEITGTTTGPGVTTPLLAGDADAAADAPEGTPAGAIFIFKVTGVE